MKYETIRSEIVAYAQKLYHERLVSCTSGNISVRLPDEPELMAITPGSEDYLTMTPERVVIMRLDGTVVDGPNRPSSEWRMHAGIYAARGDIGAVVHTHSAYATAFAVLHRPIPVCLSEMVPWLGGDVGVAPFGLPGTAILAETALPLLRERYACLLGNHGVLAVADTLPLAYTRAAYVEDAARVCCIAQTMGQPVLLTQEEIEKVRGK